MAVAPYQMPSPQPIRHRVGLSATLYFTHTETDPITNDPVDISAWTISYRQWDENGILLWTVAASVLDSTHYSVDLTASNRSSSLAADSVGSWEASRTDAGALAPLAFGTYSVASLYAIS